ncbi:hypothetical protein L873DRAFT_1778511 [Choiromyces venosus 120613-1]|uniref:Uncharacterized protein n=1 Tax=Choiromyces venosus 120613-1 TaxID=1336337 RepID=A0A3N4JGN7_9PEZI|nr:hypothetical protein L873DRAFT_1778511 [Choiromyces venosus 120613-1]
MLAQSLRVSRTSLTRCLARQQQPLRTFIVPTAPRKADIVQDMYLTALKAYKPAPAKASDSEGQVKKWVAPAAPQSPEAAEASLAQELKAYEAQEVEIEGQSSEPGLEAKEEDWFEEEANFGTEESTKH